MRVFDTNVEKKKIILNAIRWVDGRRKKLANSGEILARVTKKKIEVPVPTVAKAFFPIFLIRFISKFSETHACNIHLKYNNKTFIFLE